MLRHGSETLECDAKAVTFASCSWESKAGGGEGGRVRSINQHETPLPPPRNFDISMSFFLTRIKINIFFNIFKIKWPNSGKQVQIGGMWFCVPEPVSQ